MRIYKRFFNTRILFPFLLQNRDKKAFCQNFPAVFFNSAFDWKARRNKSVDEKRFAGYIKPQKKTLLRKNRLKNGLE